jgi:hypothetical protein
MELYGKRDANATPDVMVLSYGQGSQVPGRV